VHIDFPDGDALTASEVVITNAAGVARYPIEERDVYVDDVGNLVVDMTFHSVPPQERELYRYWPVTDPVQ
jgi:hypothetical protein